MDINNNNTQNNADTLLESLLVEFANAKELASDSVKQVIRATALNESLKESMNEDEDEAVEDEVEDATEIEDAPDADEIDADEEGEDLAPEDEVGDVGGIEDEGEESVPDGSSEPSASYNPLDEFEPDENGDYDLVGVTDLDKILDIAQNAPDGTKFVMVKRSAFDVSTSNGDAYSEEPDAVSGLPAGDMDNDTEEEPMSSEDGADMNVSADYDADYSDDDDENNPSGGLKMGESMKRGRQGAINESDFAKVLKIKNGKIAVYETKIRQLQKALDQSIRGNKALGADMLKMKAALNEGKEVIHGLSLVNKNLVHIARLFTENATTKDEKKQILSAFNDKVKTLRESELLFEFYSKNLSTRNTQDAPSKEALVESAQFKLKNPVSKVNESTSFKKPKNSSTFVRFSEYEI